MNYKSISSREAVMMSLLEESDLPTFSVDDIARLSGWERGRIYNTLASLSRKGHITRVMRGQYTMSERISENIFQICTDLVRPSYISFWTAMSRYGFTEQQVRKIQLVSTKQVEAIEIGNFGVEIITLKPPRFFGYVREDGFVIAEREKALIDSLFRPDLCGGLDEFTKCLENAWDEIDEERLVQYAIRFDNRSLISRLGYLIEELGLRVHDIGRLADERSRSYVLLDLEGERRGDHSRRWRVVVNHEIRREMIA